MGDLLVAAGEHHADEFHLMFVAKGGGSANKTFLFQETRAVLSPQRLLAFLESKMKSLGTSACPPYHLAIVLGGTSAELALDTAKLASTRYLDSLPTRGNTAGHAIRDPELEQQVLKLTQSFGIGFADDNGIGTGAGAQHVMLQRVPNSLFVPETRVKARSPVSSKVFWRSRIFSPFTK